LLIDGAGNGDPDINGYSGYASIGQYRLQVDVPEIEKSLGRRYSEITGTRAAARRFAIDQVAAMALAFRRN